MTNDWRSERRMLAQQFAKESKDGLEFEVILFEAASGLDDAIKQADAGDREARKIVMAFVDWTEQVEAGIKHGRHPICFGCGQRITRKSVAAIAYLSPLEQVGTVGLIMVLCGSCRDTLSHDQALAKLRGCIEKELHVDVEHVEQHSIQ